MNTPYTPQPSQHESGSETVPSYLVWAILCTLCCCLPGGIVSIVYAAKVDGLLAAGDIEGARDASGKAKMWAIISAGVGLVVFGLYFAFIMFSMITAAASGGGY